MNIEKVLSLLRLARKGRRLEIGRTAVTILLNRKRASLVIIAADASDKLKKEITADCLRRNVSCFIFSTREELGSLFSRENIAVIGITDKDMAEGIRKALGH